MTIPSSDGPSSTTQALLRVSLEVAVPMWIERLRDRSVEHILERAKICGEHIAERGDVLQFKGKSKKEQGKTAEAFLDVRWEARP